MTGHFATARAGHDAGGLYVVVREEGPFVYLSDGRLRSVESPKKKNRRHIQIIRETVEPDILGRLLREEKVFDHEIKYAIKQYIAARGKSQTPPGGNGKESVYVQE